MTYLLGGLVAVLCWAIGTILWYRFVMVPRLEDDKDDLRIELDDARTDAHDEIAKLKGALKQVAELAGLGGDFDPIITPQMIQRRIDHWHEKYLDSESRWNDETAPKRDFATAHDNIGNLGWSPPQPMGYTPRDDDTVGDTLFVMSLDLESRKLTITPTAESAPDSGPETVDYVPVGFAGGQK